MQAIKYYAAMAKGPAIMAFVASCAVVAISTVLHFPGF